MQEHNWARVRYFNQKDISLTNKTLLEENAFVKMDYMLSVQTSDKFDNYDIHNPRVFHLKEDRTIYLKHITSSNGKIYTCLILGTNFNAT